MGPKLIVFQFSRTLPSEAGRCRGSADYNDTVHLLFHTVRLLFRGDCQVKGSPRLQYTLPVLWKERVYLWERRHSRIRKEQCQENGGFVSWQGILYWRENRHLSSSLWEKFKLFCIPHSGGESKSILLFPETLFSVWLHGYLLNYTNKFCIKLIKCSKLYYTSLLREI